MAKRTYEPDNYTVSELAKRWRCSRSTVYKKMNEEGAPRGGKPSKERAISKAAVHAWEMKHMPWLHECAPSAAQIEEDKVWEQRRREAAPIFEKIRARRRPVRRAPL
jgi:predicted DNA-binding transcriptional regulator AlpA